MCQKEVLPCPTPKSTHLFNKLLHKSQEKNSNLEKIFQKFLKKWLTHEKQSLQLYTLLVKSMIIFIKERYLG